MARFLLLLLLWPALLAEDAPSPPDMVTPEGTGGAVSEAPRPAPTGDVPAAVEEEALGVSLSLSAGEGRRGWSNAIKLLLLLTVLSVAPALLMICTSFTRVIIVLGFARRALGTQTLPPNQVLIGLALFMTMFIMTPTVREIYDEAYAPYVAEEIGDEQALERGVDSIRAFMARHTRKADLAMFIRIAGDERPATIADVALTTLVPAFITSELKTAFQMGFVIFLPFLVIDMVIAAVLMALGMMMLPPVVISLPFKILLFVLVDGWTLLVQGLVASYA